MSRNLELTSRDEEIWPVCDVTLPMRKSNIVGFSVVPKMTSLADK